MLKLGVGKQRLISLVGRKTYWITELNPATTYEITCTGHTISKTSGKPIVMKQMVITKSGRFVLQPGYMGSDRVQFRIDSNLRIPFHCSLFNSKGIEVSAKDFDSTTTECSFPIKNPDPFYRAQCVARHSDGRSLFLILM